MAAGPAQNKQGYFASL